MQSFLGEKVSKVVSDQVNKTIEVDQIELTITGDIVLKNVFVPDNSNDTLFAFRSLHVDVAFLDIFDHKVHIESFVLEGSKVNVFKDKADSLFNFSYLLNSFESSTEEETTKEEADGFEFSIASIKLKEVKGGYHDFVSGDELKVDLGSIKLSFDTFDLSNHKLNVSDVILSNSEWYFSKGISVEDSVESALDWVIGVDQFKIENTKGEFNGDGLSVSPSISFLIIKKTTIDLSKMDFSCDEFVFKDSKVITILPTASNDSLKVETDVNQSIEKLKWNVNIKTIDFHSNSFYISESVTQNERHIEIDSLTKSIKDVSFVMQGIHVSEESLKMKLKEFSCKAFSNLNIKSMSGDVLLDSTQFTLSKYHLETGKSSVNFNLKTSFPSLLKVMSSPQALKVEELVLKGNVSKEDVEVFIPLSFLPETINKVNFNVHAKGYLNDFTLSKFLIESENQVVVDLNGVVKGLPALDSASYQISVNKLMANIPAFQDLTIKQGNTSMNLPNWIDLKGSIEGVGKKVVTHLNMISELGELEVNGGVDLTTQKESYDLSIIANKLALGEILGDKVMFGNTSFDLKVNGAFFDLDKMKSNLFVDLKSIVFQHHEYKNSSLTASWKNKEINSAMRVKDKQLDFSITTKGRWRNNQLTTWNDIDIRQLKLKALKLSERDINITSKVSLETIGMSLDEFYTSIDIKKGLVAYAKNSYNFGQSKVVLDLQKSSTKLNVNSPIAIAAFESKFNVEKLPSVIKHQLSHYFNIEEGNSLEKHKDEDFSLSFKVLNEKVFEQLLVPGLEEIKINEISLTYTSDKQQLNFIADIPVLNYNQTVVDSIYCKINTTEQLLTGSFTSTSIQSNGFIFEYPSLDFQAANNKIDIDLMFRNELRKQKFGLKGDLQLVNNEYIWHTSENGLMLYYEPWEVSKNNKIIYNKNGEVKLNDVTIKNGVESISVANSVNKEVKISFNNFTIENLTSIFYPDEESIKGLINGSVELGLNPNGIEIESDINIENLAYNSDTIGHVNFRLQNPKKDNYRAKVVVKGVNKLYADMQYESNTGEVVGEIDLTKFELTSLKRYTRSSVKDLTGIARGRLNFNGTLSDPKFKGKLSLNDVAFHAIATNTTYYVHKSEVKFTNNELRLENVSIEDIKGNKAIATGYMTLDKLYPNKLRFDVSMTEFPVLQTKQEKDKMFYGNVAVTTDFSVRGTFDFPIIESKLKLAAGSMLTIVVPESEFVKEDYSDVVEFVDFSKENEEKKEEVKTTVSTIKGIQLNTTVEVNPDVTLKLIVDPIAGDYLLVKGNAYLNFELSPDGQMKLVGVYVAKEGHYQMTYYNIIKRKFSISEGSTVTWTGDLIDAQVNIDAVYATKASPLPLVQAQIGDAEANALKQSIPVNVVLTVSEQMLSPKLNFDIRLPNYSSGSSSIVKSKLNQMRNSESEMNKQAFSLLVLNRFIPNDPSQNSTSNSLKSTARGSVSQLVTEQFNALAGNYIKAVNVNFNVDSYTDYSSGKAQGRTDLEIELSKAIFHDRLVVTVGSDFNVEGEDSEEDVNNIVGNVRAEYLMSEDGVYRIKVYRQNEYAGSIDGNITKTGLSFIFTEEFKSFGKKKVKKEKKTQKEIK